MATIIDHGRQAISTRYIGPSNVRGSRIVASCPGGRKIIDYDDSLSTAKAHAKAALALIDKMGWNDNTDTWHQGGTSDGFVFVNAA